MIDFRTQKMFTVFAELYKANEGMDKKTFHWGLGGLDKKPSFLCLLDMELFCMP